MRQITGGRWAFGSVEMIASRALGGLTCHIDANLSNQTIHANTRQLDHGFYNSRTRIALQRCHPDLICESGLHYLNGVGEIGLLLDH